MKDSLYRYMKPGIVHFMAFPSVIKGDGPVVETVRKIATDEYFTAIEITTVKDPGQRAIVKNMLRTSHMTVCYGGQPRLLTNGLNVNDLDKTHRDKAIENLKEGIDEAYEMGAAGFDFLSGPYDPEKVEETLEVLIASTKELCAYVKSKGEMRVALEVFDYDVDKKSLIGPAHLARRYAAAVRESFDNFGLMVDLSHIPLIHETIEESILPVKDFIIHAHIGNCVLKSPDMPAYGDLHPCFGFPNGENDVEEVAAFLKLLLEIGFLNKEAPPVLSFEIRPFGDEDPDVVIANAKRTLNEAWAKIELP